MTVGIRSLLFRINNAPSYSVIDSFQVPKQTSVTNPDLISSTIQTCNVENKDIPKKMRTQEFCANFSQDFDGILPGKRFGLLKLIAILVKKFINLNGLK